MKGNSKKIYENHIKRTKFIKCLKTVLCESSPRGAAPSLSWEFTCLMISPTHIRNKSAPQAKSPHFPNRQMVRSRNRRNLLYFTIYFTKNRLVFIAHRAMTTDACVEHGNRLTYVRRAFATGKPFLWPGSNEP
jgi:hypothetical protein